jgi:hypothetical protein
MPVGVVFVVLTLILQIPHLDRHGSVGFGCVSSGVDVSVLETSLFSHAIHGTHRTASLHISMMLCCGPDGVMDVRRVQHVFEQELDTFGPECLEQLLVCCRVCHAVALG